MGREVGAGMARTPVDPDPRRGISRRALLGLAGGLTLAGGLLLDELASPPAGGAVVPVADIGRLPGPTPPPIRSCQAWGARDPSDDLVVVPHRPTNILVHHTATENRDNVGVSDLDDLARAIQKYHMDSEGWSDSGQQFLVNRGGLIAEGRHRSLELLRGGRAFIEGAQCTDHNDDSIGIENQGTYTDVDPPPALLASLAALLAYACRQYGVDPSHLKGHRDFGDTACPGDRLYALLPALRVSVARRLGQRVPPPGQRAEDLTDWPLLRLHDRGARVLAAQHLLRAAGMRGVPADGEFGSSTADGVQAFQRAHGGETSGMIGGASWPRLAVPVRSGAGGEAGAAVQALVGARSAGPSASGGGSATPTATAARGFSLPDTMDAGSWKRLLAAAS